MTQLAREARGRDEKPIWSKLAAQLPQPIFVLASPRSFTSIVCAMIGQHPQAYGVPEINLLTHDTVDELLRAYRFDRHFMLHGILRAVAQLYGGEQTLETVEMARRWLNRRSSVAVEQVYLELCRKLAPLHVVDKSPAYSMNPKAMSKMRETFPGARFIYVTRHPLDQGKSCMSAPQEIGALLATNSMDYRTEPPTIDPQLAWCKTQERILEFLARIPQDRQVQLRGEGLLAEPRAVLERLCGWLGLEWSEENYQLMLRTEESPYACMGPFGCQAGNNPGFQKSPKFRQRAPKRSSLEGALPWRRDGKGFEDRTRELALRLGYD